MEKVPAPKPEALSVLYANRSEDEKKEVAKLIVSSQKEKDNMVLEPFKRKPVLVISQLLSHLTLLNERLGYEFAGVFGRASARQDFTQKIAVGGNYSLLNILRFILISLSK